MIHEIPSTTTGVTRLSDVLQKNVPARPDGTPLTILTGCDGAAHERMVGAKKARSARANSWGRLKGLKEALGEFHFDVLLLQVL